MECSLDAVTGNITESSVGPYLVGNVIQFNCTGNYVHISGDLRRACKNDQTLTGEMPKCKGR